jgi:hypothetical protein
MTLSRMEPIGIGRLDDIPEAEWRRTMRRAALGVCAAAIRDEWPREDIRTALGALGAYETLGGRPAKAARPRSRGGTRRASQAGPAA